MDFLEKLKTEGKKLQKIIVFPEGKDAKILEAAYRLARDGLVKKSIVLGNKKEIEDAAKICKADLSILELVDPEKDSKFEEYVNEYYELRKHKNITMDFAKEQMKKTNFFGAMCVRMSRADGMVAGINSETKPFIPAFEIVKTAKWINRASSMFFMVFPDKVLFYADCGMNINPDEDTLAEIGIATIITVKKFGYDPRVAFLSFSTRGSANDPLVDKVRNATIKAKQKAKELGLDVPIDGEMQFDAAFVPEVTKKKASDSPFVNGPANTFIFPDLNAGNICYKITERLGGAMAFGPIFQGLNKPVNDLSRGAKVEDIINVALITAIQAT